MDELQLPTTVETFAAIAEAFKTLSENHSAYALKGNKSAASRSRKACSEIKKLASLYRKQSIAEIKSV